MTSVLESIFSSREPGANYQSIQSIFVDCNNRPARRSWYFRAIITRTPILRSLKIEDLPHSWAEVERRKKSSTEWITTAPWSHSLLLTLSGLKVNQDPLTLHMSVEKALETLARIARSSCVSRLKSRWKGSVNMSISWMSRIKICEIKKFDIFSLTVDCD